MIKSTVVERQWHEFRWFKRERLNLFDCKVTLGWVTVLIWRFEGSLRERLEIVEGRFRDAVEAAKPEGR